MLTFYGDDATLEQQRLLGAVVRELHAHPTLTRSMISGVEQSVAFLAGSNLDQQPELVRLTPINFSLEELSKLWSFLLKTDYVLSTAYVASVVLIETDDPPPPPALPVLTAGISALPFRQPVIASIQSAVGPDALIVAGSQIVIAGKNFILDPAAGSSSVTIGGQMQTPSAVSDTRIVTPLPPGLAAGAQTVQIIQAMMLGAPPVPHQLGFQSDLATFVLHPEISRSGSPASYQITVGPGAGSPPGVAVTVAVSPTVRAGQRAILELLQPVQPSAARLFDGGSATADTDTLVFQVPTLPSGSYLVRVRVNGAESPFDLDPSGAPVAPRIDL
jgi:Pvc16 N-terminal domain/IPT/TIG domain